MKRIVTLNTRNLEESEKHGGCGECQTSCQSACKTSCGVANQKCERVQLSYDTVLTGVLEAKTICPKDTSTKVSIHSGTYTLLEILIQKWKGEL